MAQIQTQRWCKVCERKTLHARGKLGAGWGIFLTVITAGLFIPVWMLMGVWDGLTGKWRCQQCGRGRLT